MKGFTKKEVDLLVKEAIEATKSGKSLSRVFESVAEKTGRAKGSVRNYYYFLMKDKDPEKKRLIEGSGLKVEKIESFSKAEELKLISDVLKGVKSGKSVRKSIIDLAGGDDRLELRIQNKYRNLVKSSPHIVESVAKDLNIEFENKLASTKRRGFNHYINRVSSEIDGLVERIKQKYIVENERLIIENTRLKMQLEEFGMRLGVTPITEFFNQSGKKTIK